ncbi:subtilisin-like protein [Anaeromyces robustus]|uniref:Subtilisin-like protein n=1 Tax=Anaeromyces robustus TaxID=1754192 RepID=A0A1Y1X3N7_9FUNG|nr:subtilisin-like protein [Anaeromyces robustus]|eukprot:ORX80248.1 subtilisin-like protein [Anaeromyces robustus]
MNSIHLIFIAFIAFNVFISALAENAFYIISIKRNDKDRDFDDESDTVQTEIVELVNDRMNDIYEIIEDNMDSYRLENGKMDEKLNEITSNSLKKRQFDNDKFVKFNFINNNRPNLNIKFNANNKRSLNSTDDSTVEYIPIDSDLVSHICPILNYYTIKAYLTDDVIKKVLNLENVISCEKAFKISNPKIRRKVPNEEEKEKLNNNNNNNNNSNNKKKRSYGKNGKYYNKDMIKEETNWSGVSVQEHDNLNYYYNYFTHLSLISQSKYYPSNTGSYDYNYYYPESAGEGIHLYFIETGIDMTMEDDFDKYKGETYERTITCDTLIYSGKSHPIRTDKEREEYCETVESDDEDEYNHGVGVASVAAGTIFGVAKKANMHTIATALYTYDVLEALDYIKIQGVPHKSLITSSRGGWTTYRKDLQNKITELKKAGYIIFVSAGNTYEDCCVEKIFERTFDRIRLIKSFSYYDDVIVVGAIEDNDIFNMKDAYQIAEYSSYGKCIDLFAPGEVITPSKKPSYYQVNGRNVDLVMGTSFSAPIAAGVAATIMSEHPDIEYNYDLMKQTLIDLSLKDVLLYPRFVNAPNRFLNNGKKMVFSPTNYYGGCGENSPEKECNENGCCTKYGTCVNPSFDINNLCYINNDCQLNFGKCY